METPLTRPVPESRVRQRVGEFLEAGEPLRLISAAASIPELTWADIASQTAEAYEIKARQEAFQNNPKESQLSKRQEWEFRQLASKLREEEIRTENGETKKLEPPSEEEMKKMFGEVVLNAGKGKPNR